MDPWPSMLKTEKTEQQNADKMTFVCGEEEGKIGKENPCLSYFGQLN